MAKGKSKKLTCKDCYFGANLLCALQLEEPCSTFRPDRPEGLVPPSQLSLISRQPDDHAAPGPIEAKASPDHGNALTPLDRLRAATA